jgi:RHS repeat-associated protein
MKDAPKYEQGYIAERRSAVYTERSLSNTWGRHRHPTTWSYTVHNPFGMGGSNDITLRGYTFHEHLHHFSLINMNGRLYDYVLGRMLSPDNYVQSPNSSQSFNRYSYCWNNPLKYTDPSGEIIEGVIVATVGFTVGYVSHGIRNNDWGKDALVSGAISAAVATIGFYSGGAAISAKSAFAYSGKFAANAAINSVIPPAQVQMGNVNMSIGIGVGFGTTGFGATGSFGIGFKNDCFSFGIGLGGNDNMVAWRSSFAFKLKKEGEWHGASYGRTYYGDEIGPDGVPNRQVVGQLGIQSGRFSFRIENDFMGDGHDRWRSNAAAIGWGNWELGTNLRNNLQEDGIDDVDDFGEDLCGNINNDFRGERLGKWVNGQTYSSPIWLGYKNGMNIARLGISNPMVQDRTQNWVHKNGFFYMPFGHANFFSNYSNFKKGGFSYSGYNNPFSLW